MVHRCRLVDEEGVERGPFVSLRHSFAVGEEIARGAGESYEIVNVIEADRHENFRAYLVVRVGSCE